MDEAGRPVMRSAQDVWDAYRIGPAEQFGNQRPYPGGQFPVAHFWELVRHTVPRWLTTTAHQHAALCEVVRAVGRCVLVGLSQGGGLVAHVAATMPVAAAVLLEPHGLPTHFSAVPAPQLLVTGDNLVTPLYRGLAATWDAYRDTLARAGSHVTVLDLPAHGVRGNTHVMMMDANSVAVATLITAWLDGVAGIQVSPSTSSPGRS